MPCVFGHLKAANFPPKRQNATASCAILEVSGKAETLHGRRVLNRSAIRFERRGARTTLCSPARMNTADCLTTSSPQIP